MKLQTVPSKVLGFANFPHLSENLVNGRVFSYDTVGYTRDLTELQQKKVKEVEKQYDGVVVAVVETNTEFGVMSAYCFITDEDEELYDHGDGSYGIFAHVVSTICEEAGSVGIKETTGLLRRVW
jgi:hypothetical protein